ncbi:MAG: 4-hydroxy-tetrahydrodipicolinate synthase [Hyphomicrobiales bacterium]|nr:4-hydroxy-tetrahydrodipicolinate synthase [Hyphomicrobiales bacterium]
MAHFDRNALKGSLTALVTPFIEGRFDEAAYESFVDWQITQGTHGLVPVGTTGESPTLSHEEHHRVVESCIKTTAGRVPVVAGAGSNNTAEAVDLARHAEKAGADAVLVVTPYYNKPSQEGLYQHFKAINDAIGLPIIIYNIPPRSIVDMSVETMARLFELKNIAGVKDATGNIGRVSTQRHALGADFIQLCGDDMLALAAHGAGARGCISVTSNVAPRLCADMQEACASGAYGKARDVHDRLTPLHGALFVDPNPAGPKFALAQMGKMRNELRLPMVPASTAAQKAVREAMAYAGLNA